GVGDVMQSASTEVLPDERIINSQRRTELERHLATMDERYRRLIELRFFKEYSYEEIAEALSLPLGTVKTQIHRAREKICKLITTEL
ncbi:MAG: sigma-70 family RNA polymerase sigma factor, partial [Tidjanibacter sp.]|nr:sigma-70 family RNA polymerase sigma factor [Tidjanibacter sp.]